MLFTPNQIEELLEIIKYHQIVFIARQVGGEVLSTKDRALLKKYNIDIEEYLKEIPGVEAAYLFGVLAEALGDSKTKELSFKDFKKYLAEGNYIPLSMVEEEALKQVKFQAYNDISGLSNKIQKDFYQKAIEVETTKVIEGRKGIKDLVSNLQKKTKDYNRDFGRIADYIMHSCYETGRLNSIEHNYGEGALVYKDVYPGACKYCIELYLTNGLGSEPRTFKSNELRSNGTNIGRKTKDWKSTLGPVHPWCRCTVHHLSEGYTWNEDKKIFDLQNYIPKVKRKSKIKIQVGDKSFEV